MKEKLALVSFVAVTVIASLSTITLVVIWIDGSWYGRGAHQIHNMIRTNCAIAATGFVLAGFLWRYLRR
jgi:hypothetical protein